MQRLTDSDPRRLGNYRLSARLGAGGMGIVYLGYSRSGTPVAVKVIHSHLVNDRAARNRFRREVDAAIRVSSRYTARVLDADPSADQPFFVTEYVAGLTLAGRVAEDGPLDQDAAAAVAAGVAAGIAAIHAVGVVHRDLSPSNVILTIEGPRIIDLGIAWVDDATTATQTGNLIGTPAYMAPEVIRGQPVGSSADVFAWGALVHFAATGASPFGSGPAHAMLYRIVHEEPDLDQLGDPLRDLVAAALAKTPVDRPPAAQLVRQITGSPDAQDERAIETAVATLLARTHNLAGVDGSTDVLPTPHRSRRLVAAIGTAALITAALAGGAWAVVRGAAVDSPAATASPSPLAVTQRSESARVAVAPSVSPSPSAGPTTDSTPSMMPEIPAAPAEPAESEPVVPPLNAETAIGLRGIGPIEAGMTLAEAEQVGGVPIVAEYFDTFGGNCYYAHVEGLEEHFDFLVESPGPGPVDDPYDGIITRVSATEQMRSPAQTLSGIGIGDSEDDVYNAYPGQIEAEPHLYVEGGHYLRFIPRDPEDQAFGLVFFTDGRVVQEIHAGDAISSGYVEGCA